jgi:hypothetical protein
MTAPLRARPRRAGVGKNARRLPIILTAFKSKFQSNKVIQSIRNRIGKIIESSVTPYSRKFIQVFPTAPTIPDKYRVQVDFKSSSLCNRPFVSGAAFNNYIVFSITFHSDLS